MQCKLSHFVMKIEEINMEYKPFCEVLVYDLYFQVN